MRSIDREESEKIFSRLMMAGDLKKAIIKEIETIIGKKTGSLEGGLGPIVAGMENLIQACKADEVYKREVESQFPSYLRSYADLAAGLFTDEAGRKPLSAPAPATSAVAAVRAPDSSTVRGTQAPLIDEHHPHKILINQIVGFIDERGAITVEELEILCRLSQDKLKTLHSILTKNRILEKKQITQLIVNHDSLDGFSLVFNWARNNTSAHIHLEPDFINKALCYARFFQDAAIQAMLSERKFLEKSADFRRNFQTCCDIFASVEPDLEAAGKALATKLEVNYADIIFRDAVRSSSVVSSATPAAPSAPAPVSASEGISETELRALLPSFVSDTVITDLVWDLDKKYTSLDEKRTKLPFIIELLTHPEARFFRRSQEAGIQINIYFQKKMDMWYGDLLRSALRAENKDKTAVWIIEDERNKRFKRNFDFSVGYAELTKSDVILNFEKINKRDLALSCSPSELAVFTLTTMIVAIELKKQRRKAKGIDFNCLVLQRNYLGSRIAGAGCAAAAPDLKPDEVIELIDNLADGKDLQGSLLKDKTRFQVVFVTVGHWSAMDIYYEAGRFSIAIFDSNFAEIPAMGVACYLIFKLGKSLDLHLLSSLHWQYGGYNCSNFAFDLVCCASRITNFHTKLYELKKSSEDRNRFFCEVIEAKIHFDDAMCYVIADSIFERILGSSKRLDVIELSKLLRETAIQIHYLQDEEFPTEFASLLRNSQHIDYFLKLFKESRPDLATALCGFSSKAITLAKYHSEHTYVNEKSEFFPDRTRKNNNALSQRNRKYKVLISEHMGSMSEEEFASEYAKLFHHHRRGAHFFTTLVEPEAGAGVAAAAAGAETRACAGLGSR